MRCAKCSDFGKGTAVRMKVRLELDTGCRDMEVWIRYAQMDKEVKRLESLLKSYEKQIHCRHGDMEVWINASEIYYVESVDKKTFVCCEKEVYRSEQRLYQLLEELSGSGFVQVNKGCILNINVLEGIRPLLNSRMEARLRNDERINVTRRYIPVIKNKLQEER